MRLPIIIIGTGLAGYQLAREFRKIDKDTPLTLITADDGHYYPKPQLSTALTNGKTSETLITASAETMASQLNSTIMTHCPIHVIDPEKKAVFTKNDTLYYDKLVLATGSDTIKPPLTGDAVDDVLSVNHIRHYAAFQASIKNKKNIAILGAGLIGCEFANDLCNAQYNVHIIAPVNAPLDLLVPEKIGLLLKKALENHGVRFHLNCVAHRINKIPTGYSIELSDGTKLEVECILSAIGIKPHVGLAEKTGIKINRGIVVDHYLETSVPNIFALGDCAEVLGHVLPYISPILQCSRALALTLARHKTKVIYPAMPVMVKTPAHPIAVCPPPKGLPGEWIIETDNHATRALFYNDKQELYGFVLTHDAVKERLVLAKQVPALF